MPRLRILLISPSGYSFNMSIRVKSLHPLFAASVSGMDLSKPVDPGTLAEIVAALDRHAVLLFPGQALDDEQQIHFAMRFGPPEKSIGAIRKDRKARLRSEIADVSNLNANNGIRSRGDAWRMMLLANELWHTDSSFK